MRGRSSSREQKVDIQSPLDALSRDLRFIYQELNLVQQMDVARNMFLGLEPELIPGLGIVNKRKLYSLAQRVPVALPHGS